jgi:O-antigen ligase
MRNSSITSPYPYFGFRDMPEPEPGVLSAPNRTGLDALTFALLWCFIFSVPFETSLMVPSLGTISRLFGIAVMPIAVLAILARGWVRQLSVVHWCMVAFVSWSTLSYFWSVSRVRTQERVFTEIQLLIIVLLIWQFCTAESNRLTLAKAYVFGTLVSCASTMYRYAAHEYTYYGRFSAEGFDPNDLSLTLALSIPLSYYLFLRNRTAAGWVWLLQIAIAMLSCFLTASRMGAVVLILALSIVLLTAKQLSARRRMGMGVLFLVAMMVSVSFIPKASWKRISTLTTEVSHGTLNRRTEIWAGGVKMLGKKPIFGVGAGAFPVAVWPMLSHFDVDHAFVAHNTYLSVVTELGAVGLLLFLILLAALITTVLRMERLARKAYGVMFLVWFVGVCVLSWEYRKPTWVVFALIAQAVGYAPKLPIFTSGRRRLPVIAANRFARTLHQQAARP